MITHSDRYLYFEFSANQEEHEQGPVLVNNRKVARTPFLGVPLIKVAETGEFQYSVDTLHPLTKSNTEGYTLPSIPVGKNLTGYSNFAIACYFKTPTTIDETNSKTCHIFDISPFNLYLFMRSSTNYLRLRINTQNAIDVKDMVFEPNTTYHVFITKHNTTLSLYINKDLKGTFTTSETISSSPSVRFMGSTRYTDTILQPLSGFFYFYLYALSFTTTPTSVYLTPSYRNRSTPLLYPQASRSLKGVGHLRRKAVVRSFIYARLQGSVLVEGKPPQQKQGLRFSVQLLNNGFVSNKFLTSSCSVTGLFKINFTSQKLSSHSPFTILCHDLYKDFNSTVLSQVKLGTQDVDETVRAITYK